MIKCMSVIALSAYIFSHTRTFNKMLQRDIQRRDRLLIILFFSGISILGTFMNIRVNGAYANTRPIGAAVAGLFFGPFYGVMVGIIAGFQRYLMGGFTAFACSISTVVEGLVGGLFYEFNKRREYSTATCLVSGIIAETLQMIIILAVSRPYADALYTVKAIAVPMIVANSIGIAIFVNIITETSKRITTQAEMIELEKQAQMAAAAELKMLQAQIQPHFLFNALNTIASFCRTDPSKARELILYLSNFFRKTLNRDSNFVTVDEEISLVNSYLSIEKARFGERLNVIYDIPEELSNKSIPAFIIQPLVENSIKYGISPLPDGGIIHISIKKEDRYLLFEVSDTGIGMTEEKLNEVTKKWPGIGLKNINERLKAFYGEDSSLTIKSRWNSGTSVSYKIPCEELCI